MDRFTIGLDFGTLSGRAVILDLKDGREIASSEYIYPNGVMKESLPNGVSLGIDWALQSPQDYLDALFWLIPNVIKKSGVRAENVIGLGLAFTSSTILPILSDGTPLCFVEEFKSNPHSWVKLWMHHSAQIDADRLNKIARKRNEPWLQRYGGTISPEWQVPKVMQVLREAPEVYKATHHFIEAGDWLVSVLTGRITKCTSAAGFKGIWSKADGYPSRDFFTELDPGLENYISDKMNYPFVELGENAGGITPEISEQTGLLVGTVVASANIDAHATVPAVKVNEPNTMLAVIGTSTGQLVYSEKEVMVPGIAGVVDGGVYPGYFGYETGQNCVGENFSWFVKNCVPKEYVSEAEKNNLDIHSYLTQKAKNLSVGESGLVALDWWNGNRSILVDMELSGLIIGIHLDTKPEDIYRTLLEATAFGTRKIIENYEENGVPIEKYYASGGIANKNDLMMQIYADVLNLPIHIAKTKQGPASGSAVFAAAAAGSVRGGYDNIIDAVEKMGNTTDKTYYPNMENKIIYDKLYNEYSLLHDYFGNRENSMMHRLKKIRTEESTK